MNNLRVSGKHYNLLKNHLFPGDGKEAVAILLCGRSTLEKNQNLLTHKLILIPHEDCSIREKNLVQWPTKLLESYLPEIVKKNWAVVKIHSHPTGYAEFSEIDNKSDRELFESIYGWTDNSDVHGSLIMLPDGAMIGRLILPDLNYIAMDKISIAGSDLLYFEKMNEEAKADEYNLRTRQAFGAGTVNRLKNLKVGVIGCSGTGSPVIEQLVRLGVGNMLLIDPDEIETKNLNRILNSTIHDVNKKKVDVLTKAINNIGLGTKVNSFSNNIYDSVAILKQIAACDVVFGCVDSIDGRHLLNLISTFYLIPYIDVGIKLTADMEGGVSQICGTIHYVQPGASSLRSRGLYTPEELRSAGLLRNNPEEFEELKKSGYITNIDVESPAVISVNMQAASMAVNEFLARIHPYRFDHNDEFAITRFSLTDSYIQYEGEGPVDKYFEKYVGRGDIIPFLNMPEFG